MLDDSPLPAAAAAPTPRTTICTTAEGFALWLGGARPGDIGVYWNGLVGGAKEAVMPFIAKRRSAVFAAAWAAADAGGVALFQRRIATAASDDSAPHFAYLAVRLSARAGKWLDRFGEKPPVKVLRAGRRER